MQNLKVEWKKEKERDKKMERKEREEIMEGK
jgi:hypothetical protein